MHPPGQGPSQGKEIVAVGTGDGHPGMSEMVERARHACRGQVGQSSAVVVTVGQGFECSQGEAVMVLQSSEYVRCQGMNVQACDVRIATRMARDVMNFMMPELV